MIKKIWENRPFRTFLQAFISVSAVGLVGILDKLEFADDIKGAIYALLVAGLSAGISALMNYKKGE